VTDDTQRKDAVDDFIAFTGNSKASPASSNAAATPKPPASPPNSTTAPKSASAPSNSS
jgi:hypothetical protein